MKTLQISLQKYKNNIDYQIVGGLFSKKIENKIRIIDVRFSGFRRTSGNCPKSTTDSYPTLLFIGHYITQNFS